MAKKLHPSVQKFKDFVHMNPHLIQEVKEGKSTWQEMFEDWYLLGEDDPRWKGTSESAGSESEKKNDWMGSIMDAVKNMDSQQLQGHINNLSSALGAVQGVLSQFQGNKGGQTAPKREGPAHPFSFRKD